MAGSISTLQAQAIKICELCEEDPSKWKCVDCTMDLCSRCKNSHVKIPATSNHQIVTIGTPIQEVEKKVVVDNIPCQYHEKKTAVFSCKSCDALICSQCVSTSHKTHDFIPIESALDEKLENLANFRDIIAKKLKSCDTKTSEIKSMKPKYESIFDESVTKIKQREQELIGSIKKCSKKFQEKVKTKKTKVSTNFEKIEQDVNNSKKNLEDKKDEVVAAINSRRGSVIFNTGMKIEELKIASLLISTDEFIPAKESETKIEEIFGSFEKTFPEIEFEVINPFTTDLPYIDRLVTLDEKSVWINCFEKSVIREIIIEDNNITTSKVNSLIVYDMAATHNNELLLQLYGGNEIKLLKRSGELVTFMTLDNLQPKGIHVTKDNDVLIGVTEGGETYSPKDDSIRAVIVCCMNGEEKHRYQYDKDGQRLFTVPYRITTNYNQDILVVDDISDKTGRVVVLDKEGKLRWVYEGHSKNNAEKEFDPRDIATTTVGHIIISDYPSHALHVLSEGGEVLFCNVMIDIGIEYPMGLDIDTDGKVWLACGSGGKEKGAKLHIIKLV